MRKGEAVELPCYFCKRAAPGDDCEFYAGFCLYHRETRAFLSDTTHVRAEYRDVKQCSVPVCDGCATRTRLWYHLPWVAIWGSMFVVAALVAAVAGLTGLAGDGTTILLAVCGLFAVLGAIMALVWGWPLLRPESSPAVTLAVLERVKKDPKFQKKGDSFFGPEEYRVLFKHDDDAPLSADEILARDRTGEGKRERKPKVKKKKADTQTCPFCGAAIATYAQACSECKQIIS